MDFDFIIVGAGPVGSYLANSLLEDGYSVGIFERKKRVGEGVICSGIVGKVAYEKFALPGKAIIREISSLKVFSPSLIKLDYFKEESFAYIVDREVFDKGIFSNALNNGVESFLGRNVSEINRIKGGIEVVYSGEEGKSRKSARCAIIASGNNFSLHKKIGLSIPEKILWGNRVEVSGGNGERSIEVYILDEPDLSSFGWFIPLNGHTRIGVLSNDSSQSPLKSLIYKSNGRFNVNLDIAEKAPIACGNSKEIVGDRVLAVGEAAGQVKTTTGGGIYYGLVGASIAKDVLAEAAKEDDFSANVLSEYQKIWNDKMGEEIKNGIMVRNVVSKITPKLVDNVFDFLKKNPSIKENLAREFRFDYHQNIIKSGIKFFFNKVPKKFFSLSSSEK
jgi:digeranylgeranylglycerophospholipid reductase